MDSVLEQRFTLQDILDPAILEEVLDAYGKAFGLGVTIVGLDRVEALSVCPARAFCRAMEEGKLHKKCREVMDHMTRRPLEGSQVLQIKSFCGMKYSLFPLAYQLEILGRVMVGPFRSEDMKPEDIQKLSAEDLSRPVLLEHIQQIPAMSQVQLKKAVRLLAKMLDAYLFVNAKRLMTTKIHLEAVYSEREAIFRRVELQDSGSAEDKEEIEKLKDLF